MHNPVVEALQKQVGQKLEQSPSPVSRWLNGTLLSVEEGMVRLELEVRENMTNPMDILHGGATAMIMDDAIGMTVYTLNRGVFYTSTNLAIDYLNPAKLGERIIAEAKIIRPGKTIVNASCRIMSEKGLIIATSSSNLVRTFIEKKAHPKEGNTENKSEENPSKKPDNSKPKPKRKTNRKPNNKNQKS